MKSNSENRNEMKRIVSSEKGSWRREKSTDEIRKQNSLAAKQALFVVKKHDATTLHYHLRLGHRGVLVSWALPEGPSYCSLHAREAIEVPDHSRENAFFEGCKLEGFEAGIIMLWDWGTWEPLPSYVDVERSLRRGELKFILRGEKLKGIWTLKRVARYDGNRRNPHWLLIKEQDTFARGQGDTSILDEAPNSVSTKRSLEEIDIEWNGEKGEDELQGRLF